MEQIRTEVWDHIYRQGPQTAEQLVASLGVSSETIAVAVQHEWFETQDFKIKIATGKPANPSNGLIG